MKVTYEFPNPPDCCAEYPECWHRLEWDRLERQRLKQRKERERATTSGEV